MLNCERSWDEPVCRLFPLALDGRRYVVCNWLVMQPPIVHSLYGTFMEIRCGEPFVVVTRLRQPGIISLQAFLCTGSAHGDRRLVVGLSCAWPTFSVTLRGRPPDVFLNLQDFPGSRYSPILPEDQALGLIF